MDNLDYGVIGNCMSAALVSRRGAMDWACLPNFESPSVFARLLDADRGGYFAIEPTAQEYETEQRYLDRTNVLVTTFRAGRQAWEIIDFMPRYKPENGGYHCPPEIVRLVRTIRGKPTVRVRYDPRLRYAQYRTQTEVQHEYIKSFTTAGNYESLYLYTDLDMRKVAAGDPIRLEGQHYFLISYNQKILRPDLDDIRLEYERTKVYWMNWVAKANPIVHYEDAVVRSSLVLKLLAYQKTGAILAAITTSLPETIGDVRNWDYRYCWVRDASMTINILNRLGHANVARRFLQFILDIVPYKDEKIQIVYGIHGQKRLQERTLDWLAGYRDSRPVRVGNAAYLQKQNDIYGVLVDVIHQYLSLYRNTLDNCEDLWTVVRTLVRHVQNNWTRTDRGIWEFRSERKNFTFSKVLCWVATDRGARIAEQFGKRAYAREWRRLGARIRRDIMHKGWHPQRGAFTQAYGEEHLDASNLLMEHYHFLSPKDPHYVKTVHQTYKELCVDGLMYRYRNRDDFGLPKASFVVCTFWMIRALWRIGDRDRAREMLENVLAHSNHLGLFSEDLDFTTKRLLGNFPQGYSHLALVDTALALDGAEDRQARKTAILGRQVPGPAPEGGPQWEAKSG